MNGDCILILDLWALLFLGTGRTLLPALPSCHKRRKHLISMCVANKCKAKPSVKYLTWARQLLLLLLLLLFPLLAQGNDSFAAFPDSTTTWHVCVLAVCVWCVCVECHVEASSANDFCCLCLRVCSFLALCHFIILSCMMNSFPLSLVPLNGSRCCC